MALPATRQRQQLDLFRRQGTATAGEMAAHLGLSPRTVVALCRGWLTAGFLSLHDPSRTNRSYQLGPDDERLVPKTGFGGTKGESLPMWEGLSSAATGQLLA